jgi:pyruvate kinase
VAAGRRHLNIRGKSANLPAITERDWLDIKFGVDVGVDYYALSFVRNADVIYELKHYLAQQGDTRAVPHILDAGAGTSIHVSTASVAFLHELLIVWNLQGRQ